MQNRKTNALFELLQYTCVAKMLLPYANLLVAMSSRESGEGKKKNVFVEVEKVDFPNNEQEVPVTPMSMSHVLYTHKHTQTHVLETRTGCRDIFLSHH